MRVLVGCEYSGIVRSAFARKGHDAWSCDLLPTEVEGNHYVGDLLDILYSQHWDLLIAHPPCQYLSYAGTSMWNDPGRVFKRLEALEFFAKLWEAPVEKICLENPKGCASPTIAKFSQEIQPYYFGDPAMKTTWLWLKNLAPLRYDLQPTLFGDSTAVDKPEPIYIGKDGRKMYHTDARSGNRKDSAKERARFWPGIANAMADQWG